jgi:acyl-coenzyme A thioesterase PaaI-like protein
MDEERARDYRGQMAAAADPPPAAGPAVAAARALRRLQAAVTGSTADDASLAEVARVADQLADRLEGTAETSRYPQAQRLGGPQGSFLTHPIIGPTNPIAPPVALAVEGDQMAGHVTYANCYEGPPGFAHGGHIAAAFDVICATTAGINGVGGLTKSLAIRYRRPAPLHQPLVYRGTLESVGERSAVIRGTLHHGEDLCAEAEGHFAYRAARPAGSP